ncbi:MAG: GAF domain-containing protein [Proteobacteria bacterium]|nr:GAF domain-containing protein [Pseudomonadota bacterium]
MKNVAIVGGGKEGLSLLPIIKKSSDARVVLVVDRNPNALIFKLKELGYKIADGLKIKTTSSLTPFLFSDAVDLIIDASEDDETRRLLHSFHLDQVEIISPLSARLIWGHLADKNKGGSVLPASDKAGLLSSLKEVVDAVNLAKDHEELLAMVLRVALSSTGTERGSVMLIDRTEKHLKMAAFQGIDSEIAEQFCGRIGEGIAGKVAESGEPLLLSGRVDDSKLDALMSLEKVKAALSVPLLASTKVIGVLNVSTDRGDNAFNENDLEFLTELASMAAGIILRSQEIEEMRHHADSLMLWKALSAIMNSAAPLDKKLRQVATAVSEHTNSECMIYLPGGKKNGLYLKASSSTSFSSSTHYQLTLGEGIEGSVAQSQSELVMTGSLGNNEKFFLWAFPLLSEGMLQGVMKLTLRSKGEYELEKEIFPGELASFLAKEINSAAKDEKIAIRETKISAINEAGINLIAASKLRDVARIVSTSAAMIFDAEATVFRFKKKDDDHYKVMAAYGAEDKDFRISLFKLDKGLAVDTATKKSPLIIDDFSNSNYQKCDDIIKTGLCSPITWHGDVIGTLSLYNKILRGTFEPIPFDTEDCDAARRFLSYAEKALANIMEIEKTRELTSLDELTSLPNAATIEKSLNGEMERSRRLNKKFSFALIEVANFNRYVVACGREESNRLVSVLASIIVENLRGFDLIGRLWGSRFALILPELGENGKDILKRLIIKISKIDFDPHCLTDELRPVIVFGLVDYSGEDKEVADIMKEAAESLETDRRKKHASRT